MPWHEKHEVVDHIALEARKQRADREGAGPQDFKSRPNGLLPPVRFQPLKVPQPSKAVPPASD